MVALVRVVRGKVDTSWDALSLKYFCHFNRAARTQENQVGFGPSKVKNLWAVLAPLGKLPLSLCFISEQNLSVALALS